MWGGTGKLCRMCQRASAKHSEGAPALTPYKGRELGVELIPWETGHPLSTGQASGGLLRDLLFLPFFIFLRLQVPALPLTVPWAPPL